MSRLASLDRSKKMLPGDKIDGEMENATALACYPGSDTTHPCTVLLDQPILPLANTSPRLQSPLLHVNRQLPPFWLFVWGHENLVNSKVRSTRHVIQ